MVALLILAITVFVSPANGRTPTSQPDDELAKEIPNLWGRVPDPDEDRLVRAMQREAEALQISDVVSAEPYAVGGGLIEWNVYFDQKALAKVLADRAPKGATAGEAQIVEWQDATNAKLVAATIAAYKKCGEADLNPETDISSDFAQGVLKNRSFCGTRSYRGSRFVDGSADSRKAPSTRPATEDSKPVARLDVEVVLAKARVRPREAVTGTLKITNSGTRRISIRPSEFPDVFVTGVADAKATPFRPTIFICGTPLANTPPMEFKPGVTIDHRFEIETDPLGVTGGTLLSEGRFEVSFPDLMQDFNIPTYVKPALLTVKAQSKSDLATRIIRFGVGGRRIVTIREHGVVQVFDIDKGSVLREFVTSEYTVPESWERNELVSPNGRYLALIKTGAVDHSSAGQVTVYDLDLEAPTQSVLFVPANGLSSEWPWQHPWLVGFNDGCEFLTIGSVEKLCRINVTTGSISNETDVKRPYPISPDGLHYVEAGEGVKSTIFVTENRKWTNPLRGPGKSNCLHWGRRGLFVGWSEKPGLTLFDEEGELKVQIPCKGQKIVAESPDGRYLAIERQSTETSGRTAEIEIWDLESNSRRLMLDDEDRTVTFSGQPVYIVVGKMRGTFLSVTSVADEFEVRSIDDPSTLRTLVIPGPGDSK